MLSEASAVLIGLHNFFALPSAFADDARYAVLGADAVLCRENLETLSPPGFSFDQGPAKKSFARQREKEADPFCEGVLLFHDRAETKESLLL